MRLRRRGSRDDAKTRRRVRGVRGGVEKPSRSRASLARRETQVPAPRVEARARRAGERRRRRVALRVARECSLVTRMSYVRRETTSVQLYDTEWHVPLNRAPTRHQSRDGWASRCRLPMGWIDARPIGPRDAHPRARRAADDRFPRDSARHDADRRRRPHRRGAPRRGGAPAEAPPLRQLARARVSARLPAPRGAPSSPAPPRTRTTRLPSPRRSRPSPPPRATPRSARRSAPSARSPPRNAPRRPRRPPNR